MSSQTSDLYGFSASSLVEVSQENSNKLILKVPIMVLFLWSSKLNSKRSDFQVSRFVGTKAYAQIDSWIRVNTATSACI